MIHTGSDFPFQNSRPSGAVAREAGCFTQGPGFESWVRHGCQTIRPWNQQWLSGSALETTGGPSSIPGRTCRPSRSEFSVVFSETRVNTG